ncbi:MAG: helix-turn-helix domain-containing protein [Chloroflexi bacterium]|nr:helix-turn-helix domain-containing protein [Chloroflexota bacterium]
MAASSFARLLRQHRLTQGLTQEELAERAGVSARAISDLERGLKRAPRASTVRLLADALQLGTDAAATLLVAAQGGDQAQGHTADQRSARDNLPRRLSSFVGRQLQVAELVRQVERKRLVTLVGPGGVGKTRLALEVAARCGPVADHGVYLVELASVAEANLVPERLAATLGISERTRGTLLATLGQIIGQRQLLLVMDNCEHLVGACAQATETLLQRCPRVHVLATSREPLGIGGEQVWPVTPLSLVDDTSAHTSEAVQLFVERGAAAVPSFSLTNDNRQAVLEICARLDGIPLAIELAAARVKTLTPVQILSRIDDRFQFLIGGSRTAHARQQTLQATVTWSYELLGVHDRHLFDQLAVFSGGWDLQAAEIVCAAPGLGRDDVLNGLERLVDRSLVLAANGRYWMLETLRQYANERLRDRNATDALRERHADYYLRLAEAAEPEIKRADQAAWLERLAIEHDNLRAALRWSIDVGGPELGLRLAIALARFWEIRGHFGEGRRWFAELLGLPNSAQLDLSLRAAAVAHAGYLAYVQGNVAAAHPMLEEGARLARIADAPATVAFALFGIGQMWMMRREYATARPLLTESLALARQLNDAWATARALSNVGTLAREEGDIDMARALLEEGLAIARQAGERRIESSLQISLAMIAYITNDPTTAIAFLEASLATKRDLGDRYQPAMAYRTLGWIAFDRRDYVAACQYFLEALSMVRDLGPLEATPRALAGLACVGVQLGQMETAMRLFAAETRASEYVNMQAPSFLDERHRRFEATARQALGSQAESVWSEGLALGPDQIWAEAARLAQAAESAVAIGRVTRARSANTSSRQSTKNTAAADPATRSPILL